MDAVGPVKIILNNMLLVLYHLKYSLLKKQVKNNQTIHNNNNNFTVSL